MGWIAPLYCRFHRKPCFCNLKKPDSLRIKWICMWVSLRVKVAQLTSSLGQGSESLTQATPFSKSVGVLKFKSILASAGRCAGVLWLMYPRTRMALGRRRTSWFRRPCDKLLAPSGAFQPCWGGSCPSPWHRVEAHQHQASLSGLHMSFCNNDLCVRHRHRLIRAVQQMDPGTWW